VIEYPQISQIITAWPGCGEKVVDARMRGRDVKKAAVDFQKNMVSP
jgi:hypothetical protein